MKDKYIINTMTERLSESTIRHIKTKIKVVFLGEQSTGKTAILLRFMHHKFQQTQAPTVGIDFMAKNLQIGNTQLRLQLWDTAGQQRFRSLIPSYLKDATLIFVVFDLSNIRSFQSLGQWFQLCHQNRKQKSIMVLVGNKSDLTEGREVKYQDALEKAKSEGVQYFEVSAKNDTNINQIFQHAGEKFVQQHLTHQTSFGNIENMHEIFVNKFDRKGNQQSSRIEAKSGGKIEIQAKNQKKKANPNTKLGCC